ncbi:MAG: hypothetical protein KKG75_02920 [Nanoarchaeota archaeon]|nr:hypothetical protein [Nanoarchaeota archaeon]
MKISNKTLAGITLAGAIGIGAILYDTATTELIFPNDFYEYLELDNRINSHIENAIVNPDSTELYRNLIARRSSLERKNNGFSSELRQITKYAEGRGLTLLYLLPFATAFASGLTVLLARFKNL